MYIRKSGKIAYKIHPMSTLAPRIFFGIELRGYLLL